MKVAFLALACAALLPAQVLRIERVAGLPGGRDPGPFLQDFVAATDTSLCEPSGLAVSDSGVLFIADSCRGAVRAVGADGVITTIAGGGSDGEGGPARLAALGRVQSVAWAPDGSLYLLSDSSSIRRVDPAGVLTTVWLIDDVAVWDIAVDGQGALYAAIRTGVLKRTPDGRETLLVGARSLDSAGLPPPGSLFGVFGIAADGAGNVYIAESETHLIHRVNPDGSLNTIAGVRGQGVNTGDGGPAMAASFSRPFDVAITDDGSLYVVAGDRVRRIDPQGTVTTIAGGGRGPRTAYWGDGGPATDALLADPWAVAVNRSGDVFISERAIGRVRKVDAATGMIHTVAGAFRFTGDGPRAEATAVGRPSGMAFDAAGNLFFADTLNHRIRRIALDGSITTVAGSGESGFAGDGGRAVDARLSFPLGVAVDALDRIYIADTVNNRIRRVSGGIIETLAGDGTPDFRGDGGPSRQAWLAAPKDVAIDAEGRILISDTDNHRVRRIELNGVITTLAGSGQVGTAGDGGPATLAQLILPEALAVAPDGSIYIADPGAQTVRRIADDGRISTVAGALGFTLPPIPPSRAPLDGLFGVTVGADGEVWIAANRTVHRLRPNGDFPALDIRDRRTTFRPTGSVEPRLAIDAQGRLWMAGRNGVYRQEGVEFFDRPVLFLDGLQVGGRAGFLPLSPGAVIQVFGERLGPAGGAVAQLDADGRLPRELNGVRLLIDGTPAPLLFTGAGQVNAIAPFALTPGGPHLLEVEVNGVRSNALLVAGLERTPAFFANPQNFVAALNQNGTVNLPGNPEARGSIVSLFLTGFGAMAQPLEDGVTAAVELVGVAATVRATVGGAEAQILYAGTAPGLVHGVVQINLGIPFGAQPGESKIVVWVGGAPTQAGLLAVR